MKKGLLLVVVMLATIAVKAQDIYVGGSLNVWRNSTGNTTSFKVAPEIGYNFNETWALGAELNYSHEYVKQVTANTVTVAPYIRWSYYQNDAVDNWAVIILLRDDYSLSYYFLEIGRK